ncbi:MAG: hypothetical protein AAF702_30165 [Chloroflexota bacterium]
MLLASGSTYLPVQINLDFFFAKDQSDKNIYRLMEKVEHNGPLDQPLSIQQYHATSYSSGGANFESVESVVIVDGEGEHKVSVEPLES